MTENERLRDQNTDQKWPLKHPRRGCRCNMCFPERRQNHPFSTHSETSKSLFLDPFRDVKIIVFGPIQRRQNHSYLTELETSKSSFFHPFRDVKIVPFRPIQRRRNRCFGTHSETSKSSLFVSKTHPYPFADEKQWFWRLWMGPKTMISTSLNGWKKDDFDVSNSVKKEWFRRLWVVRFRCGFQYWKAPLMTRLAGSLFDPNSVYFGPLNVRLWCMFCTL